MSISDQIKCAKRELALRRKLYPRWVDSGRMKPEVAEHEAAAMAAIVDTLETLEDKE